MYHRFYSFISSRKHIKFDCYKPRNRHLYCKGHPEATQSGCSRSYRVNLTSSMSTTLSMVFAVTDIEDSDGLLVYLPSGDPGHVEDDTRDYMAIEMVDRRIRFLWNNGAGKRT